MNDSFDICNIDICIVNAGKNVLKIIADFVPVSFNEEISLAIESSAEGTELNDNKFTVYSALNQEFKHVSTCVGTGQEVDLVCDLGWSETAKHSNHLEPS